VSRLRFMLPFALAGACASVAPTPKVTGCAARYQGCVIAASSMADYVTCRTLVDRDCLDGGAP